MPLTLLAIREFLPTLSIPFMPVSLGVRNHGRKGFIPISEEKQLESKTDSPKLFVIAIRYSKIYFIALIMAWIFWKHREIPELCLDAVFHEHVSWWLRRVRRDTVCWTEKAGEKDDGWGSARMKGSLAVEFNLPGLCHQARQKITL